VRAELDAIHIDARPRLSWRIGVSGHIKLPDADREKLELQIGCIFDGVKRALEAVRKEAAADHAFSAAKPRITFVSPLAEGSDRICAEIAVKKGVPLASPLPLQIEDYKQDFRSKISPPTSVQDFERLLKLARQEGGVVELEGKGGAEHERNASYLAVGEFVLRHCDMLIAVWNGDREAGVGGTGEVVRKAHALGLPVIHVQSASPHGITIREGNAETTHQAFSDEALTALISRHMLPKVRPSHHTPSLSALFMRVVRRYLFLGAPSASAADHEENHKYLEPAQTYFLKEPLRHTGDEPDFLYKGPFKPAMPWYARALASVFPLFARLFGKPWFFGEKVAVVEPELRPPPTGPNQPTVRYLFLQYQRADALATFYAQLHRSAFMLVYGLSALALIFAVLSLFANDESHKEHHLMTLFIGLELSTLFFLGALVFADNDGRWRDRFLEYRLLAELLREADLLAQIGRPMPFNRIDDMVEDLPGRAWVMIVFRAIVRSAELVPVKHDASFLTRVRDYATATRLQDQIAYHNRAKGRNESIGRKLQIMGYATFSMTIVVAATEFLFPHFAHNLWLAPWAGILPAIAYAAFGIRNQAEFEIVSKRSERMIAKLERQQERTAALTAECLTSEALGREILHAAAVMRHDAADWTSIFEVKETETA
jgi:hypothetical protein